MQIRFGYEITVNCPTTVPMILALSTHSTVPGRMIGQDIVRTDPVVDTFEYLDRFGNRITRLVAPAGRMRLWSDAVLEFDVQYDAVVPDAIQHKVEDLPHEVLQYLVASRYCDSDSLVPFAWKTFGHTPEGWARVAAICDYVHKQITFGYKFGRTTKTATDVNLEKTGVCRDFAHLSIALCRAMNIPARYVSGYLGDIFIPYSGPGDFCAWFEVYLGGAWYTFDARYNVPRAGRIAMVRGCDAADVAMITSFGSYQLEYFRVWTDEVPAGLTDAEVMTALQTRPNGDPLVFPSSGRTLGAAVSG